MNKAEDLWNILTVVIETLWNVNIEIKFMIIGIRIVVIETLWNVNMAVDGDCADFLPRCNRDIVECKCPRTCYNFQSGYNRCNRDIVECKYADVGFHELFCSRCNRDIVECKYFRKEKEHRSVQNVVIETLWNVNMVRLLICTKSTSCNRDIVECK